MVDVGIAVLILDDGLRRLAPSVVGIARSRLLKRLDERGIVAVIVLHVGVVGISRFLDFGCHDRWCRNRSKGMMTVDRRAVVVSDQAQKV